MTVPAIPSPSVDVERMELLVIAIDDPVKSTFPPLPIPPVFTSLETLVLLNSRFSSASMFTELASPSPAVEEDISAPFKLI